MRGNVILMLNQYMQMLTDIYSMLNEDEIITYNQMMARLTPADELDEWGGNLIRTVDPREIAICDKISRINATKKIDDNTYKINPRFSCCCKNYDENQELTAALAIEYWDKMTVS